ncbi:hypothetical protein C0Q88_10110 [Ralstonia pickettii]|uniref:Uncharacterized protein n=1 Tax=Ralstonia pickettii TaxID=329 RepID=A0A2N4TRI5_RALPI|nr:hypothetical protein [Ralstonia pickettii]PLC42323.1 hypothetical protein C0Q88_10110 [Ralstonia pickettii]
MTAVNGRGYVGIAGATVNPCMPSRNESIVSQGRRQPPPLVHSNAHTACKTDRNQLTEKGLLHDVTASSDVDNFVRVHRFHVICMFAQTRQALL